ncbi:MAG: hypothetical protein V2J13_06275 [Cycloclasticus sp.]|nr:hypothetical protein [Cycloclasticus sp.]
MSILYLKSVSFAQTMKLFALTSLRIGMGCYVDLMIDVININI